MVDRFFGDAPGVPEFIPQPGDDRPDLTEKIGEAFTWTLTTPTYRTWFAQHIYISFLATLPIGIITKVSETVGHPTAALKLIAGVGRRVRQLPLPVRSSWSKRVGDPVANLGNRTRPGPGRHRSHALECGRRRSSRPQRRACLRARNAGRNYQGQFQPALHSATVFMPGRERTKTNCVKLIQEARMALRE